MALSSSIHPPGTTALPLLQPPALCTADVIDIAPRLVHTLGVSRTVRLHKPVLDSAVADRTRRAADLLRPYIGHYVARRDDEILTSAETPGEVVLWLREREIRDAVIFLVPVDPVAATNVA